MSGRLDHEATKAREELEARRARSERPRGAFVIFVLICLARRWRGRVLRVTSLLRDPIALPLIERVRQAGQHYLEAMA